MEKVEEDTEELLDTPYFISRFSTRGMKNIASNVGTHAWGFILGCCLLTVLFSCILSMFRYNPRPWFEEIIPPPEDILSWNQSYLDSHLHTLSRWSDTTYDQWRVMVSMTYYPFHIPYDKPISFLEVGCGVGAWSRIFLDEFPLACGEGIDLEEKAIAIASLVLPLNRISLQVLDMAKVPETFAQEKFDYVFFPGVICYAQALSEVYWILQGMVTSNTLKKYGNISLTMIPESLQYQGSCVITIPKSFWYSLPLYKVLSFSDMGEWGVSHMDGRYAVYLQRYI